MVDVNEQAVEETQEISEPEAQAETVDTENEE